MTSLLVYLCLGTPGLFCSSRPISGELDLPVPSSTSPPACELNTLESFFGRGLAQSATGRSRCCFSASHSSIADVPTCSLPTFDPISTVYMRSSFRITCPLRLIYLARMRVICPSNQVPCLRLVQYAFQRPLVQGISWRLFGFRFRRP